VAKGRGGAIVIMPVAQWDPWPLAAAAAALESTRLSSF